MAFGSDLMIKFPSKSVTAPLYESESSKIFTPGTGVPVLSVTDPVIISLWPNELFGNIKRKNKYNFNLIFHIIFDVFKKKRPFFC